MLVQIMFDFRFLLGPDFTATSQTKHGIQKVRYYASFSFCGMFVVSTWYCRVPASHLLAIEDRFRNRERRRHITGEPLLLHCLDALLSSTPSHPLPHQKIRSKPLKLNHGQPALNNVWSSTTSFFIIKGRQYAAPLDTATSGQLT